MRLSLRLLLVSLASFLGSTLRAQPNFVIDISNTIDSVYSYNEVIPITGMVTYFGSGIYQGEMQLGYATFNSGNVVSDIIPGSLQSITLQNQETADFNVEIPVSPSFFLQGGGHTVIVWPILSPEPTGVDIDSMSFFTEIEGWLGQPEWGKAKQARVYPIPATDYLTLEKPAYTPVAEITILNLKGATVYTGKATETATRIPVNELPAGMYFVRYSDGIKPAEIHPFVKR